MSKPPPPTPWNTHTFLTTGLWSFQPWAMREKNNNNTQHWCVTFGWWLSFIVILVYSTVLWQTRKCRFAHYTPTSLFTYVYSTFDRLRLASVGRHCRHTCWSSSSSPKPKQKEGWFWEYVCAHTIDKCVRRRHKTKLLWYCRCETSQCVRERRNRGLCIYKKTHICCSLVIYKHIVYIIAHIHTHVTFVSQWLQ